MSQNQLYPIFLKLHELRILIVGAGAVAEEKLHFMFKSSPNAQVRIVALDCSKAIEEMAKANKLQFVKKKFSIVDVQDADIVIGATNSKAVNREVYQASKYYRKLVNIADTPDLCDFYMGSIVTKGDLKIAISTNGKSPTFAKRLREYLEDLLPNESTDLIGNLKIIRDGLKGNFQSKVLELNNLTASLISKYPAK